MVEIDVRRIRVLQPNEMMIMQAMEPVEEVINSMSAALNPGENPPSVVGHMGHELMELKEALPSGNREHVASEIPDIVIFSATFSGLFGFSLASIMRAHLYADTHNEQVRNLSTFIELQRFLDATFFRHSKRNSETIFHGLELSYGHLFRTVEQGATVGGYGQSTFDLLYAFTVQLYELACIYDIDMGEAITRKLNRNAWKYPWHSIHNAIDAELEIRMNGHNFDGKEAMRRSISDTVRRQYKDEWNRNGAEELDKVFRVRKKYRNTNDF